MLKNVFNIFNPNFSVHEEFPITQIKFVDSQLFPIKTETIRKIEVSLAMTVNYSRNVEIVQRSGKMIYIDKYFF